MEADEGLGIFALPDKPVADAFQVPARPVESAVFPNIDGDVAVSAPRGGLGFPSIAEFIIGARSRDPLTHAGYRAIRSPLLRALHHRLLDRLFGVAEIVRGVDQRDVGQRLREIPGLAADA
jgi:hypothetical protein